MREYSKCRFARLQTHLHQGATITPWFGRIHRHRSATFFSPPNHKQRCKFMFDQVNILSLLESSASSSSCVSRSLYCPFSQTSPGRCPDSSSTFSGVHLAFGFFFFGFLENQLHLHLRPTKLKVSEANIRDQHIQGPPKAITTAPVAPKIRTCYNCIVLRDSFRPERLFRQLGRQLWRIPGSLPVFPGPCGTSAFGAQGRV